VPRFAFEKFPGADPRLTTHMKSVGEAMAIGRNFTEALQKALRSLEDKNAPFDWVPDHNLDVDELLASASVAHDGRLRDVQQAFQAGATIEPAPRRDGHRPVVPRPDRPARRAGRRDQGSPELDRDLLRAPSATGSPTPRSVSCAAWPRTSYAACATPLGIRPVFKTVDTCAAEFAALTPYHYSSYDEETEVGAPR
jgi:carbamoyl-phosphate synthase large subunit